MNDDAYRDLVPFYGLLDPREDHAEEAAVWGEALAARVETSAPTLLELGAGAGNNAWYLGARFRCTLVDISDAMLEISRRQNPECRHVVADMRTVTLNQTFSVVFAHDALSHMVDRQDVAAVVATAHRHLDVGGTLLLAPDCFDDGFDDMVEYIERDEETAALRGVAWSRRTGPNRAETDYALLYRKGSEVCPVHVRHPEALHARATWCELVEAAGFEVILMPREQPPGYAAHTLMCRKIR
ncbi:MAG: class I SAM-dependent methyltransferase [Myxococcota bacterium]